MKDLPDGIYEALPYLYVLAGLCVIFAFDVTTGRASGVLLAGVGLSVFKLRLNHRTQVQAAINAASKSNRGPETRFPTLAR